MPLANGAFNVQFAEDNHVFHYVLEHDNFIVNVERFTRGDVTLLERAMGGYGRIHWEEEQKLLRFQVAGDKLAADTKRDSLQQPFLDSLYEWGNSLRLFEFGKGLGHPNLAIAIKGTVDLTDESDTTQIVRCFNKGKETYSGKFIDAIKSDMGLIGYAIEDVEIRKPSNLVMVGLPAASGDVMGIAVKERDLQGWTDQVSVSQGMFRALSLIIQLNFNMFAKTAATILIDDIGEGLDYERSCALIKLIREKVIASDTQLIMSTNDRFIMNGVPLEDWCVLQRVGHTVKAFNYSNAADAFERFKKTGLSNFDLLTSNYVTEYVQRASQDGENGDLRRGSDGEDLHGEFSKGNGGQAPVPH
jgi:hypothetical protein